MILIPKKSFKKPKIFPLPYLVDADVDLDVLVLSDVDTLLEVEIDKLVLIDFE